MPISEKRTRRARASLAASAVARFGPPVARFAAPRVAWLAASVAAIALALLAGCVSPPAPGPPPGPAPAPVELADTGPPDAAVERGRFLLLRGGDTISVEEFRRRAGSVLFLLRVRGGATLRMEATVTPDARVSELAIRRWPAAATLGGGPPRDLFVSFSGTMVAVQRGSRGTGRTTERRDVRPGTLPWNAPSVGLLELLVGRARGAGLGVVPLYDAVGGGQTLEAFVTPLSGDSVLVRVGRTEYRLAVDRAFRVRGGRVTPGRIEIRREAL